MKSEAHVVRANMLRAAVNDNVLWRNNVGACRTNNGRVIRYGLANDSSNMNKILKSSDLIGIHKVLITQGMVGQVIGQFMTVECKAEGWKYTGTSREVAQKAWIDLVTSYGGTGGFVNE